MLHLNSYKRERERRVCKKDVKKKFKKNHIKDIFVCEIMWIRRLLMEVGIKTSILAKLWCDNQAVMHIASNPVFNERIKHIEIDCHFVCEKIQLGLISTGYVNTREQLGDIFTKPLSED